MSIRTLFEHQLAPGIWWVAADVLLDVGVLVVVDSHTLVARGCSQPADQAGLPHRRLSLDQHRVSPARPKHLEREWWVVGLGLSTGEAGPLSQTAATNTARTPSYMTGDGYANVTKELRMIKQVNT